MSLLMNKSWGTPLFYDWLSRFVFLSTSVPKDPILSTKTKLAKRMNGWALENTPSLSTTIRPSSTWESESIVSYILVTFWWSCLVVIPFISIFKLVESHPPRFELAWWMHTLRGHRSRRQVFGTRISRHQKPRCEQIWYGLWNSTSYFRYLKSYGESSDGSMARCIQSQ